MVAPPVSRHGWIRPCISLYVNFPKSSSPQSFFLEFVLHLLSISNTLRVEPESRKAEQPEQAEHRECSFCSGEHHGKSVHPSVRPSVRPSFLPSTLLLSLLLSCFQSSKTHGRNRAVFLHSQSSKCSWFSVNYEETISSTWLFLQKSWLYLSDYNKDLFLNPLFILTLQDTAVISPSFMFSVWGSTVKRLPGL